MEKIINKGGRPKKKHAGGRPRVVTPVVIGKLESIFALDGTVKEACYYAGISADAYYDFLKENPEYSDRFEALRNRPVLLARQTVVKKLSENYSNAMDYLSRKAKKEFSTRTELTGAEGEALNKPVLSDEEKDKLMKLIKRTKK
jgi:hypothetical protein